MLPLVTTAAGTKFGKTEAGTVWLDPARTSERDFYQFWLNTDDRDVINYLKFFTWLDRAEIDGLEKSLQDDPVGARGTAPARRRGDAKRSRRWRARRRCRATRRSDSAERCPRRRCSRSRRRRR